MRNNIKNRGFSNTGVRGPVSLWLMQPHPGRLIIDTRREPAFNLPSRFVACAAAPWEINYRY